MTEIYLVRHTQAEGNLYRMMQGHWDGDITELGEKQLELLAERFRTVPLDAVYSSDLYRARKTAEAILTGHDLPLQTDTRLREINIGPWETCFFGDLRHKEPEAIKAFMTDQENWYLPGAETYSQVRERVYGAVCELAEKNRGRSIAITSHGITIRCFLSRVLQLPLSDIEHLPVCGNTAVTHLLYEDGSWTVLEMNDTSHLSSLPLKSWTASPYLYGEIFDPEKNAAWYEHCYTEAWLSAHGNTRGFSPKPYLALAGGHYRADPQNLIRLMTEKGPAGMLEMDSERGETEDYLWLVLLFIEKDLRRTGCGTQALGRAIARCRALDRTYLRLNAAEENKPAVAFYRKYGFKIIETKRNNTGNLYTMELNVRERRHA